MSEQHAQGADAVTDLNNELKTRREKLASLREQGIPFPNDFRRDHTSDQLHADFATIDMAIRTADPRQFHFNPNVPGRRLRDRTLR